LEWNHIQLAPQFSIDVYKNSLYILNSNPSCINQPKQLVYPLVPLCAFIFFCESHEQLPDRVQIAEKAIHICDGVEKEDIITYDGEVKTEISRWWVSEVNSASVVAIITQFHIFDDKTSWICHGAEMSPCSKQLGWGPMARRTKWFPTHIQPVEKTLYLPHTCSFILPP